MVYVEAQETCGKDNNKHSSKHQALFLNDPHPLSSDDQGEQKYPGQDDQQIAQEKFIADPPHVHVPSSFPGDVIRHTTGVCKFQNSKKYGCSNEHPLT